MYLIYLFVAQPKCLNSTHDELAHHIDVLEVMSELVV
jgi:hypothetical protein